MVHFLDIVHEFRLLTNWKQNKNQKGILLHFMADMRELDLHPQFSDIPWNDIQFGIISPRCQMLEKEESPPSFRIH